MLAEKCCLAILILNGELLPLHVSLVCLRIMFFARCILVLSYSSEFMFYFCMTTKLYGFKSFFLENDELIFRRLNWRTLVNSVLLYRLSSCI